MLSDVPIIPLVNAKTQLVAAVASLVVDKTSVVWKLSSIVLMFLGLQKLYEAAKKAWVAREEKLSWTDHVDFQQIQACILSSEHLGELGRIEKRTLLCKDIKSFFGNNSHVVNTLLAAAQKTSPDEPVLTKFLSNENKWHVLKECCNQLSTLFAPYHVFFNESRRCETYYRSAWYCFTLTCQRSKGQGRFFVTPYRPVNFEDVGMLRIRVLLVNEEELRDIASGVICPPKWGFFNDRHRDRWNVMKRFAMLFQRQLANVTGNPEAKDWGKNLCGRLVKKECNPGVQASEAAAPGLGKDYSPEDNCFLRLHIPFPGCRRYKVSSQGVVSEEPHEYKAKDVVLFE